MQTADSQAEEIVTLVTQVSSDVRLPRTLELLERQSSGAVFWKVLCTVWSVCDRTWESTSQLLSLISRHARSRRRNVPPQNLPPGDLPDLVPVWRGCSRARVRGVAWTHSKTVAEGFAHGHRQIPVPDPVLASALIPKTAILFIQNERQEAEVVLDPRKLRSVRVFPFAASPTPNRP